MILNAYAVLDAFVSLLRLGLGLVLIGLVVATWRMWQRGAVTGEARNTFEDRTYLLYMLGGLLVGLNVISWPIFYLLLQSYVPHWPGVMCIYGVTQIGQGSIGPSRFLPTLTATLETTKPLLVFLSGGWFVLYLINKQTRTAPLSARVLAVLLLGAGVGVADAAVELAYLVIPKTEEFLSVGCCVEAFVLEQRAARFLPSGQVPQDYVAWLHLAYYLVTGVMIVGLTWQRRTGAMSVSAGIALVAGALATLLTNAVFLVEVAAPRLLHMPHHHCAYDLVSQAPHGLIPVILFVGASCCVGWACLAAWLGRHPEADAAVHRSWARLLDLASVGYLASVIVLTLQIAVA